MPQPLPPDVRRALDAGNKLEAIRKLRKQSGMGLDEAQAAVEAGFLPDAPGSSEHEPHPIERRDFPPGAMLLVGLVVVALLWWIVGDR